MIGDNEAGSALFGESAFSRMTQGGQVRRPYPTSPSPTRCSQPCKPKVANRRVGLWQLISSRCVARTHAAFRGCQGETALFGHNSFERVSRSQRFFIFAETNSPKCDFFLDLVPNRNEVSPPHGRLLPLCLNPCFGRLSFRVETQAGPPLRFRRRSAAANHDLAAGEEP
jgi:hypothetical protein